MENADKEGKNTFTGLQIKRVIIIEITGMNFKNSSGSCQMVFFC